MGTIYVVKLNNTKIFNHKIDERGNISHLRKKSNPMNGKNLNGNKF